MVDGWVIVAVLFAAVLHASWNALVKSGGDVSQHTPLGLEVEVESGDVR